MDHDLRNIEDVLQYAAESDPFRVNNSGWCTTDSFVSYPPCPTSITLYILLILTAYYSLDSHYRRITAEEVLAQRDGNAKVNLWINKNSTHKNDNRRGSTDSTNGRRGSNGAAIASNRRGSNDSSNGRRGSNDAVFANIRRGSNSNSATAITKRYHARMDAGVLSDDEDEDDNEGHNSTQSCSSRESVTG